MQLINYLTKLEPYSWQSLNKSSEKSSSTLQQAWLIVKMNEYKKKDHGSTLLYKYCF